MGESASAEYIIKAHCPNEIKLMEEKGYPSVVL
jgi:hypothetical protein